ASSERNSDFDVQAMSAAKKLERLSPTLFARAALHWPLTAVQRRAGSAKDVENYLRGVSTNRAETPWGQCATSELTLLAGKAPAKSSVVCEATSQKPRLDGQLDDDVWKRAKKLDLRSSLQDDADWPAVVSLARDDEFLYFAATCQKHPL